jgi:hypothetical protein
MSGNKYIDMICTPGPYILGAADPDVNAAVAQVSGPTIPAQCRCPADCTRSSSLELHNHPCSLNLRPRPTVASQPT